MDEDVLETIEANMVLTYANSYSSYVFYPFDR